MTLRDSSLKSIGSNEEVAMNKDDVTLQAGEIRLNLNNAQKKVLTTRRAIFNKHKVVTMSPKLNRSKR